MSRHISCHMSQSGFKDHYSKANACCRIVSRSNKRSDQSEIKILEQDQTSNVDINTLHIDDVLLISEDEIIPKVDNLPSFEIEILHNKTTAYINTGSIYMI